MFIQNTSIYKIQVKQMIFYFRFPDYSSSLSLKVDLPVGFPYRFNSSYLFLSCILQTISIIIIKDLRISTFNVVETCLLYFLLTIIVENDSSNVTCEPWNCDKSGYVKTSCDSKGQCECKYKVHGLKCSKWPCGPHVIPNTVVGTLIK